jgi:hypothetical protein
MQHQLEHDGRFEQPGSRSPEFGEGIAKRVSRRVRHRIAAVFARRVLA